MNISNYCFLKVILASTKIDKHGDKISMKALNDLQDLCLGRYGVISTSEDCNTTCYISYTFIEPSWESDGIGEAAYNLYGIIMFDGSTKYGKIIRDSIKNLGNNLYDVASIGFIVGSSEMLTTQLVRNILSVKDFLNFSYRVRSKDSVRNQNRLDEVIEKSDICPFCGSKPIVTVDGENISGLDKFRITIKCINIECNVQPKTSFYDSSFTTACDMVLKHWNTRSSDSGIDDTRCHVNCVNCGKDADGMYYCTLDNHFIPGEHPFRHTDCHDFEQKDSNNLSCVSNEDASKTETTKEHKSLCLSCVNAEFDKDGCYCKAVCHHVVTKGCKSCVYYDKEVL
jgi:hypothetical protein